MERFGETLVRFGDINNMFTGTKTVPLHHNSAFIALEGAYTTSLHGLGSRLTSIPIHHVLCISFCLLGQSKCSTSAKNCNALAMLELRDNPYLDGVVYIAENQGKSRIKFGALDVAYKLIALSWNASKKWPQ